MNAKVLEFEGTDGAGKTTAMKYVIEKLRAAGKKVLETREVGNPNIPVCVQMRETVLSPDSGLNGDEMEVVFASMRVLNQAYYRKISKDYDYIVSDRGWLSHLAYTDHNVNPGFTDNFYGNVIEPMTAMPDMVLYFRVDTQTALQRRVKRGTGMDVIEMKGIEFQNKVRDSFRFHIESMEANHPEVKVAIIDANQNIEGVREQLDALIKELV